CAQDARHCCQWCIQAQSCVPVRHRGAHRVWRCWQGCGVPGRGDGGEYRGGESAVRLRQCGPCGSVHHQFV
ncbi:hypothetical protein LTR28_008640, partial [Elasticomyces elasticus]